MTTSARSAETDSVQYRNYGAQERRNKKVLQAETAANAGSLKRGGAAKEPVGI